MRDYICYRAKENDAVRRARESEEIGEGGREKQRYKQRGRATQREKDRDREKERDLP